MPLGKLLVARWTLVANDNHAHNHHGFLNWLVRYDLIGICLSDCQPVHGPSQIKQSNLVEIYIIFFLDVLF